MDNTQFGQLCDVLELGKLIKIPVSVSGGLLHAMWHIVTDKNEYAVKELNKNIIIDQHVIDSYELTENIARAFYERGIPAIASLKLDNKALIKIEDNIYIVYPWVKGNTLGRDEVSKVHAVKVATILATIHKLNLHFIEITHPEWDINRNDYFGALTHKALQHDLSFAPQLSDNLENIFLWNKKYQQSISKLDKTLVVSHGDLDQKNILWTDNLDPVLIDWESARLLNPTQEILNAALDWSGVTSCNINRDIFQAMLIQYKKTSGTIKSHQISAAFWGIIGNWINWLTYNIKRSLDKRINSEEKILALDQAHRVLNTLIYLTSQMDGLIHLI